MKKTKVVIIGAGPAGLTAGYELLKEKDKYEVIILEESANIGGISRTVRYQGNRMDIGGHRFFSKDPRVTDWWLEIMPMQGKPALDDKILKRRKPLAPNGPDPEKEDKVMLVRRRVSRIYYRHKFFDYPISMKLQTIKNMGFLTTMRAGFSYLKAIVAKKPEDSLENFYINRFGKVLYSMFFEGYTEKLWGRHPKDISADWGAQRVKGLSIIAVVRDMFSKVFSSKEKKREVETSLIEEFIYPKYGPGQLWETVAACFEAQGGVIQKNALVDEIRVEDKKVTAVGYTAGGERKTLEGDIFISTMPLKDLVAGMGDIVPKAKAEIAKGLPYRDFVTIGVLVDKLNLKNETDIRTLNNIVPDCWIYVQDTGVKLGRIQIFNNWSPYMVKDVKHSIWIGLEYFCMENDDFWNMTDNQAAAFAARELIKMGVISRKEDIKDCCREKVKKAYPAYFDTYYQIDELTAYLDRFVNLFCIGRNGQHHYNNMDHSMVTAFEAVKNIKNHLTTKDNIWNVNTEKDYHEEGKTS